MKYKKFIVFQFEQYYPQGGLNDIKGSFDSLEEAIAFIQKNRQDYNQIVNRDTWGSVIYTPIFK